MDYLEPEMFQLLQEVKHKIESGELVEEAILTPIEKMTEALKENLVTRISSNRKSINVASPTTIESVESIESID